VWSDARGAWLFGSCEKGLTKWLERSFRTVFEGTGVMVSSRDGMHENLRR
jgi:hypothetical protein